MVRNRVIKLSMSSNSMEDFGKTVAYTKKTLYIFFLFSFALIDFCRKVNENRDMRKKSSRSTILTVYSVVKFFSYAPGIFETT